MGHNQVLTIALVASFELDDGMIMLGSGETLKAYQVKVNCLGCVTYSSKAETVSQCRFRD